MFRGIRFKIVQNYGRFLCDLFVCFNLKNYNFIIRDTNIYNHNNNQVFNLIKYDGSDFKKIVCDNDQYKIYCANIQVSKAKEFNYVNNYFEFLNSDLELVVLIYDYNFVEVYCKNNNENKILINNIKKMNVEDIEEITEKNDDRIGFYI